VRKRIFIGLVLLWGSEAFAIESEFPCYELTSDDVASIINNEVSFVQYEGTRWDVVDVGWGLTCLDYCPPGFYEVSDPQFCGGKCIYTIKNAAPEEMLGESTTITLKPREAPAVCNKH
jgi:hypothetical protein